MKKVFNRWFEPITLQVFDSRLDMIEENVVEKQTRVLETVCITPNEYYGLVVAVVALVVLLVSVVLLSMLIYRYVIEKFLNFLSLTLFINRLQYFIINIL